MAKRSLLLQYLKAAKNDVELQHFINALFTPSEIAEFDQRLKIIEMLLRGSTQRQVKDRLNTSIATVTRGARELKYGYGEIFKIIHPRTKR